MSLKISIIVPTRDRPQYLYWCIKSLLAQTYDNFEVLILDNPSKESSESVVRQFDDSRIVYHPAERPLSMKENWERGLDLASGVFVGYVIDKTLLYPEIITEAVAALELTGSDLVSWWGEGFDAESGILEVSEGQCRPLWKIEKRTPRPYSGIEFLKKKLRFDLSLMNEGADYFQGKICFGLFGISLIGRIRTECGEVFAPAAPDYTSMVPALYYAEKPVVLERPGTLSINSVVSNGRLCAESEENAKAFYKTVGVDVNDPRHCLKNCPRSVHNLVGRDYMAVVEKMAPQLVAEIENGNLHTRVSEDLEGLGIADNYDHKRSESDNGTADNMGAGHFRSVRGPIVLTFFNWVAKFLRASISPDNYEERIERLGSFRRRIALLFFEKNPHSFRDPMQYTKMFETVRKKLGPEINSDI